MKKYAVSIVETHSYTIEVEAENEEQAEEKAWESNKFNDSLFDENDSYVDYITEITD